MQITDKKTLRKELIAMRRNMGADVKKSLDSEIFDKLCRLDEIENADCVLCYVSTEIEVETRRFIQLCLDRGKKVYVPRCDGRIMEFCPIGSLGELKKGMYGIDEPQSETFSYFTERSVCIVPALRFNEKKFRLGYGKGYYDRFLAGFKGISIGLCYEDFVGALAVDEYDLPTDILVTDKSIR